MNYRKPHSIALALLLALVFLLSPISFGAQQGGTTRYVYDDNGRLRAVISPSGEIAIYEYDAAGNFTSIRRPPANIIEFLSFSPHEGGAGDTVIILGAGIGPGVQLVTFNSQSARVIQATPATIIAEVPDAATTGLIQVVMPGGVLATPTPFTVLPRVRVNPVSTFVTSGNTAQFSATVTPTSNDQSVRWSVNGIDGGNTTVGTITTTGQYTAPPLTGNSSLSVSVRATSVAQPALFGEAHVRVPHPNSLGSLQSSMVSVRHGVAINGLSIAASPSVSVRREAGISGSFITLSPLVSVRREAGISGSFVTLSPSVSVRHGVVIGGTNADVGTIISVTIGPIISAISPGSISRGATVTLTIGGENLSGATAIRFLDAAGGVDANIVASAIAASADGTSLTATVTVNSSATLGQHIVVVTAIAGTTPKIQVGSNTISIQ